MPLGIMGSRSDGRAAAQMRALGIQTNFIRSADGSALVELGETRVICTATVEETVPLFLRDSGRGWVTAEYGMLPGSTGSRTPRESARGRVGGRTQEIQRLIGRSLRAITDLKELGPRTVWIDCDVIQADGGTRTASITGGYVAFVLALRRLVERGLLPRPPLLNSVAAVSAGIVAGEALVDLCYSEDSGAEVDMNFVMTGAGEYVEIQGTAESRPFSAAQFAQMAALADVAIRELTERQRAALG